MEDINYKILKEKALEQFKKGKSLFGKEGAFAPLLKNFLEEALNAEMENHLNSEVREAGNKRNGKKQKKIKSTEGTFEIKTPQDRYSTFEPQIVKKRETILADNLEDKIIGLYGLGMSYRDITNHIKEMYDTEISHTILTQITDRIIPELEAWRSRQLEEVYTIVWLDAMHNKVKENGIVKTKALYNILAINKEGKKEILGIYLSENEGSKFWLQVIIDLQNRGLKDILIACIDNLKGFAEAIQSIYPKVDIQTCIVHQIRNSIKYVASKDTKEFMSDLKEVYKATTRELAEENLLKLGEKWQKKYPLVIKSWENNWENLSTYFQYSKDIRRLIYTTNIVEGYHRQVRKVTKTKGVFANDTALMKLVYLATKNIAKKWISPIPNWSLAAQQLAIKFGDRMPLDIRVKN